MIPIKFTPFSVGYCTHPQRMIIQDGDWSPCQFPALSFLLQHPQHGSILFDTGYTQRFFTETQKWPFWIYRKTTKVHIEHKQTLTEQLMQQNIAASTINTVIISHFHADHIGGLRDFPKASMMCSGTAYTAVKNKKGLCALKNGYLVGLMPSDFIDRCVFFETKKMIPINNLGGFTEGYDLFDDKSIIAVPLPGHAKGQYGLFFYDINNKPVFLIADSCWTKEAYEELKLPYILTYLIHDSRKSYKETIYKLHHLHKNQPEVLIIPSHCHQTWQRLQRI